MAIQARKHDSLQPEPRNIILTDNIIFTNKPVMMLDAFASVPSGHALAYPSEIALAWQTSEEFRTELKRLRHACWTDQVEMRSYGRHIITKTVKKGLFTVEFNEADIPAFNDASYKCRSWHHSGSGLVAVRYNSEFDALELNAAYNPSDTAVMALVKLSPEGIAQQASVNGETLAEIPDQLSFDYEAAALEEIAKDFRAAIAKSKGVLDQATISVFKMALRAIK